MKSILFYLLLTAFAFWITACGPSESVKQETAAAQSDSAAQVQPEKTEEQTPASVVKGVSDEKPAEMEVTHIGKKEISQKKVLFRKVFYPFFTDRGEVPYEMRVKLEKIIPDLKKITAQKPKSVIVIKGFTTAAGKTAQNKPLSAWRASEAAQYLSWKSGISLTRFRFHGLGEMHKNKPSAKRVEVLVLLP